MHNLWRPNVFRQGKRIALWTHVPLRMRSGVDRGLHFHTHHFSISIPLLSTPKLAQLAVLHPHASSSSRRSTSSLQIQAQAQAPKPVMWRFSHRQRTCSGVLQNT